MNEAGRLHEALAGLPPHIVAAALAYWPVWARDAQLPPEPDGWGLWLILGGRGAGKTRAGAEWVRGMALGRQPYAARPAGRIALVGETFADAREVMVEGVSGILSVHRRRERPAWSPTRRRLEWTNGTVAQLFSAEDPDSLRGPQFAAAWADELAKWRHADAAWDMLQFGLRLGARPRQTVTTTPRPLKLIRRLIGAPGTALVRMRTQENAAHLAPGFLEAVLARYGGTRLGRQELDAEILEDRPDALFSRAAIEAARVRAAGEMRRIVVAVDPPAGSGAGSAACGIVAAGMGADGLVHVLADATVQGASPAGWAQRAVALWHRLKADRLVAEANQGGDMVAAVIREVDPGVPVIRMLYQHDPAQPIGVWEEIREDRRGLFARGRLTLEVGRAREVASLIRAGALDGLSIGFRTVRARSGAIRRLTEIDLWEISVVTFPMLPEARVMKAGAARGALTGTIRAATRCVRAG